MRTNRKATSIVEYTILIVFLLAAFFVFKKYIIQAFFGQWRKAGDVFGHGRQHDPRPFGILGTDYGGGTEACFYDGVHCHPDNWNTTTYSCDAGGLLESWVSLDCYEQYCDCTIPKEVEDSPSYVGVRTDPPSGCLSCLLFCSSYAGTTPENSGTNPGQSCSNISMGGTGNPHPYPDLYDR